MILNKGCRDRGLESKERAGLMALHANNDFCACILCPSKIRLGHMFSQVHFGLLNFIEERQITEKTRR